MTQPTNTPLFPSSAAPILASLASHAPIARIHHMRLIMRHIASFTHEGVERQRETMQQEQRARMALLAGEANTDTKQNGSKPAKSNTVKKFPSLPQNIIHPDNVALLKLLKELGAELVRVIKTETCDTKVYREVLSEFDYVNIEPIDDTWVNDTDKKANATLEKLELELNSYKTNFIKESVRMAYNELGEFFLMRGDHQEALKSFIRTRDYSNSSPQYLIDMCLRIIKTSLFIGNYSLVQQYVTKAYQVGEKITDEVVLSKLRVASALADLDSKRYKSAALKFIECNIVIGDEYADVATARDIALYGGICALASFSRKELSSPAKKKKTKDDKPVRRDETAVSVINNMNFENFLELVPDVRAMIVAFYESKYTKCLEHLNALLPVMMSDAYLGPHALHLYDTIRSKALKQYVSPFTSVDMQQMAATFNCKVEDLEKDLARLIQNKDIKARIDSHNKILYARVVDQRTNTFEKIIRFGDDFVRETESHILRMNLLKHQKDFVIKAKKSKKMAQ